MIHTVREVREVRRVLDALHAEAGTVAVVGHDSLAVELLQQFGATTATPTIVVETTGTTEGVAAALSEVADLGHVVLAGRTSAEMPDLDLYADLHVRGLTLLGTDPESSSDT